MNILDLNSNQEDNQEHQNIGHRINYQREIPPPFPRLDLQSLNQSSIVLSRSERDNQIPPPTPYYNLNNLEFQPNLRLTRSSFNSMPNALGLLNEFSLIQNQEILNNLIQSNSFSSGEVCFVIRFYSKFCLN